MGHVVLPVRSAAARRGKEPPSSILGRLGNATAFGAVMALEVPRGLVVRDALEILDEPLSSGYLAIVTGGRTSGRHFFTFCETSNH